jgi:hypothetical protein
VDALPALTGPQRKKILTTAARNKKLGYVAVMRKAGIEGSRGQLHGLLDDHLKADIREARGQNVAAVEDVIYTVALDPTHPHWPKAVGLVTRAHGGPEYRDEIRRLEHTGRGGGPIELVAGQFDPDQLTTDELGELRGLLDKARRELPPGGSDAAR